MGVSSLLSINRYQWGESLYYYLPISSPWPADVNAKSKSGDMLNGIPFRGIFHRNSSFLNELPYVEEWPTLYTMAIFETSQMVSALD